MSKQEFIKELNRALQGEVDRSIIAENVAYYESYIEEQIARGISEQTVLEQLGSPVLIARTIIDTNGGTGDYAGADAAAFQESYDRTMRREQVKDTTRAAGVEFEDVGSDSTIFINGRSYDLSKWYVKALAAAIAVLAFLVVLFVVVIVLKGIYLAVKWLAVPVLIVCFISWLLKRLL